MIKILTKYISKQIYIAFFFMLISFVALFIFFDFLTEIKSIGKANYSTILAFTHVALQVPDRFYEFSPIAALIAGVFVLSRLSVKSEFVVFRTSGMQPRKLVQILFGLGIPIVIVIFLLGEFISPISESISHSIRQQALGENSSSKLKSGIWLKNDNPSQKQFIHIGLQNANKLEYIQIYKFSPNFVLQEFISAREGIIENNQWFLKQVKTLTINKSNQEVKASLDYKQHIIENININPNFFSSLSLKPSQLSISNLYNHIKYLKINKQNSYEYELAFAKKLIYPFSAILMLFLCIPFAYLHGRRGGIGIKMFMGIMLGLSFYLFYTLISKLANFSGLSVWTIQLIPFFMYSILAIIGYTIASKKG